MHGVTAHAHTLPNNGTFSIHFSLDLSVSLREWKHHDSIFIQGGFWIGSFVGHFCNKARGSAVWSERMHVRTYVGIGGEEAAPPWKENSEENSADAVPLPENSQRIPSEETAGWEWKASRSTALIRR